jgi:hypothetical protein
MKYPQYQNLIPFTMFIITSRFLLLNPYDEFLSFFWIHHLHSDCQEDTEPQKGALIHLPQVPGMPGMPGMPGIGNLGQLFMGLGIAVEAINRYLMISQCIAFLGL